MGIWLVLRPEYLVAGRITFGKIQIAKIGRNGDGLVSLKDNMVIHSVLIGQIVIIVLIVAQYLHGRKASLVFTVELAGHDGHCKPFGIESTYVAWIGVCQRGRTISI